MFHPVEKIYTPRPMDVVEECFHSYVACLELRKESVCFQLDDPLLPHKCHSLPQVTEDNTPQPQDAAGDVLLYHKYMTRVYVADAKPEERSAIRLILLDLKMDVVGEAADWTTTLAQVPVSRTEMLLIEWDLLPNSNTSALGELRRACPAALAIVLISHLDARQQAALSAGADAFISKGDMPERVTERLQAVAASVHP